MDPKNATIEMEEVSPGEYKATDISRQSQAPTPRRRAYGGNIMTKRAVISLANRIAAKLDKRIAEGHDKSVLFFGLTLALIKDGVADWFLDPFFIGEVPFIGQIPGYIVTALLVYFMWGKGMLKRKIAMRVIIFLTIDNFPLLINNLPLTTITVLWSWSHVKERALKAETDLAELSKKTMEELENLDNEMNEEDGEYS